MTFDEFERFYHQHEKAVFNFAFRLVGHRDDALDLIQEGFIKVWDKRNRINPDLAKPYLFQTIMNLARKRSRWLKTWQWSGLDGLGLEGVLSHLATRNKTPESTLINEEVDRQLYTAIQSLSEKKRNALLLSRFGELSHQQISEILDIPEGTVASRCHQAIVELKEKMGGLHD